MRYQKKTIRAFLCYLCFISVLFWPQRVCAAPKQAEIVTTDRQQDLVVMFLFDKEIVDITFLSPSGVEKTTSDADVTYAEGDLWSTYRIADAEAGTWSVQYELGTNESIDYSVIEDDYGLWIQFFEVDEISDRKATVRFEAECETETEIVGYNYNIYAVDTGDTDSRTELASGYVRSGEENTIELPLTSLSSGNYVLRLEIYCREGDVELFDSATSDSFDYINPEEPDAMEDFALRVDAGKLTCDIDWSDFAGRHHDAYRLTVYGDEELIYTGELEHTTTAVGVVFPDTTGQLRVELQFKRNGVWSKPLSRTVALDGEFLRMTAGDVTGSGQATMEYSVAAERTLEVEVNGERGSYLLNGSGTLSFDLQEGNNSIHAEFEGDSGTIFVIDTEVYFDAYPPEIKLYEKLDGKTFYESSVDILGKITGGNSLLVNGSPVEIGEGGEFCAGVNLNSGENVVSIEASDVNGNTALMNLTLYKASKLGGRDGFKNGLSKFLPLCLALLASLIIILLSAAFMKKKDKTKTVKTARLWKWVLGDIILGLIQAGSLFGFIMSYRFVNSMAYLELAEKSAASAARYLKAERVFAMASLGVFLILLACILITVVKAKKKKKSKEADVHEGEVNGERKQ